MWNRLLWNRLSYRLLSVCATVCGLWHHGLNAPRPILKLKPYFLKKRGKLEEWFRQSCVCSCQTKRNQINHGLESDFGWNAPLTFPLRYQSLTPGLHVQTQVFHHAVDAVVQSQTTGLRLDGLATDGTLVLLFAPLIDAVGAEAVSAVQNHSLQGTIAQTL